MFNALDEKMLLITVSIVGFQVIYMHTIVMSSQIFSSAYEL